MPTYPIPECLADSHDGDEWAIAAIMAGRVVALYYIADVAPHIPGQYDDPEAEFLIRQWLRKDPMHLRELQALGNVSAGIVGSGHFEERWRLGDFQRTVPPNDLTVI